MYWKHFSNNPMLTHSLSVSEDCDLVLKPALALGVGHSSPQVLKTSSAPQSFKKRQVVSEADVDLQ
ncbi:MAG: hypothetical protein CL912_33650 [Deltaproteobacteria bacterium]|nr:hypothetical protein [Deltaproteobacteria bacterium]